MKTGASLVGCLTGYVGRLCVRALRLVLHSCLGLLTGLDFTVAKCRLRGFCRLCTLHGQSKLLHATIHDPVSGVCGDGS